MSERCGNCETYVMAGQAHSCCHALAPSPPVKPEPRTSEPSDYIHEGMKALWRVHLGQEPPVVTTQSILREVARAAKVEALSEVAQAKCEACRTGDRPELFQNSEGAVHWWLHSAHLRDTLPEFGTIHWKPICHIHEVWDILQALQEGGR